jgi:predicted phosphohydrolase
MNAKTSSKRQHSLTLVLIGDTHELHQELQLPRGDILIHVGDATMFSRSLRAIVDFNDWLGELPHPHRIFVPGNHDSFLQANPANRSLLTNARLLINEGIEIEGLRIWGTPITASGPGFCLKSAERRRRMFAQIPQDTDVLISHAPPGSTVHGGDRELLDAVARVRPRLDCFGHIHGADSVFTTEQTVFVNAALLGAHGSLSKKPIVLRISRD